MPNVCGCVAKTSVSLAEVVFVLSIARAPHLVHEPKATFPIRHQESCVSGGTGATPPLAPPGTDDAKGGSNSGSYDGVSMGRGICSSTRQALPAQAGD